LDLFSLKNWQKIVIVLLLLGVLMLAIGGYLQPVIKTALNPVVKVQEWFYDRYQGIRVMLNASSDLVMLQQKNSELEQENATLRSQIVAYQQQVTEVEILSALLDFARAQPQNEYQAAAVIGQDPSPFLQYVIINRGSDDGLRRGMPVVSNEGLVGRIDAVTANAARVQLINDADSAINVSIQPSDDTGILVGGLNGEISIEKIPQNAQIQPGDTVLTSGMGGAYPANILIGTISGVQEQPSDLFQTATVQPFVDFSQLEILLVIKNFQSIDVTDLIPDATE
jgi:rod shape-determining protein MreC